MKFITYTVVASSLASLSCAAPTFNLFQWGAEKVDQLTMNVAQMADDAHSQAMAAPGWGSPVAPKPLVDSETLQAYITEPALRIRASKFQTAAMLGSKLYGHPTRVVGSAGHYQSMGQIETALRMLGPYYNVTKQYFNAPAGVVFAASLTVKNMLILDAVPLELTPPTPGKLPVTAPLVLIDNFGCNLTDYPAEVNGSIALIVQGGCPYGNKSEIAGTAGAVSAVIYSNVPGAGPLAGSLGSMQPEQVATFGVSYEEGSLWADSLAKNISVNATAFVDSFVRNYSTFNLIADTKYGDEDNVVMIGAHSDSVLAGPGINDGASGTISLLEIATALANFNVTNKVRFAWFSGTEEGLLGSEFYLSSLAPANVSQIRAYLNYEVLASPNFAYQVYDNDNEDDSPLGTAEIVDVIADYFTAKGANYTVAPLDGTGDYNAFVKAGIPCSGVTTGGDGIKTPDEAALFGGIAGQAYDPCFHGLCDDITNLNMPAWLFNTKLAAHTVATFALSMDDLPPREPVEATELRDVQFPFHGPQHLI